MRALFPRVAAALAAAAITITTAGADPYSDLQQAERKFFSLRSWHATLTTAGQTLLMDFAAPNRYRESMHGMTIVLVGSNGWMEMAGQSHALPLSMTGTFQQKIESIRTLGLQGSLVRNFTVSYTGMRVLNGMPTRTYHLVKKSDAAYTMNWWVGSNTNLPLQSIVNDDGKTITIEYSQFNAPITIAVP